MQIMSKEVENEIWKEMDFDRYTRFRYQVSNLGIQRELFKEIKIRKLINQSY